MSADFRGRWVDKQGRVLTVQSTYESLYITSFFANSGNPFVRDLLEGKRLSTEMPAFVSEGHLIVELGTVGVGPTLKLTQEGALLVPEIQIGLYDDWEDDFGVPWAFPLSPYTKADAEASYEDNDVNR